MGYVGNNGTTNTDYEASIADRTTTPDSNHTTQGAFRHGEHQSDPYSDFDQSYDRINSYNQGATAGTYTVRGGETLAAIAQSLYGDSGLWYKLAEANGLSASANLSAGTTLRLPTGVIRNTNNASTVRPHNPGETIGDISPTTPEPPKENKCGVMGQIMLVLVAVVVTAITAGATAGLGGFVSGAIAGATGSIVSQGVGVATGIQDKFSWKSVGISALTAGVSGGAGDVTNFKEFVTAAAKGAAVNAAVQGISVATGLQDKFSWSGVAAAGISAGVGGYAKHRFGANPLSGADKDLSFGNFAANMGVGAARGIANAATRSAIDGTSFGDNLIASIPDVIGQTFGDALSGAVGGPSDMFSGVNPNTGILGVLNSIGGEVSGAIDTVGEQAARIISGASPNTQTTINILGGINFLSPQTELKQSPTTQDEKLKAPGQIDTISSKVTPSLTCFESKCVDESGTTIFDLSYAKEKSRAVIIKRLTRLGDLGNFLEEAKMVVQANESPIFVTDHSNQRSYSVAGKDLTMELIELAKVDKIYIDKNLIGKTVMNIGRENNKLYAFDRSLIPAYAARYDRSASKLKDRYIANDPTPKKWSDFFSSNAPRDDAVTTLERIIVHELKHLSYGNNIERKTFVNSQFGRNTLPNLSTHGEEPLIIRQTNDFMFKYFNSAPRFELPHEPVVLENKLLRNPNR